MLYIASLFEQSVEVRDLGLLSPTKSYHLGLGPIRTTGAPAVSWQLIIFLILLNSLLLSVANILHTRYHCRRIARLATSGGIVASMWLNVVGCVRIESWVRINRVCLDDWSKPSQERKYGACPVKAPRQVPGMTRQDMLFRSFAGLLL